MVLNNIASVGSCGIVGKCNPGTRDGEAIYGAEDINKVDGSTPRLVWLRVQNPAEVCGLIAASCEMTRRCTDHPGERGPDLTQTDANEVDEENQGEDKVSRTLLSSESHARPHL